MSDTISWYDANADALTERYESVAPEDVHGWLMDILPASPAAVLDVGAGSGRDAAWLAGMGHDVVAAEPSSGMRARALARHADSAIRWIADALPDLDTAVKAGLSFDFILVSAVWMHIAPSDRHRAFQKLISLLKPGGVIAMTLRDGPNDGARGMHPAPVSEIEVLTRAHGAFIERSMTAADRLGRQDVSWTQVAIRLPDDGAGALPLLRHVILNDNKTTTYKLGLLRTLCRIADGASGLAREHDEGHVAVPLGLAALTWIRLYLPLLKAHLPQSPDNRGYERLGFAKAAFLELVAVSPQDLRIGVRFSGAGGASLHRAISDAASTIAKMPATYITYPNGGPVLPVHRRRSAAPGAHILLDEAYLASFGEMRVPTHLWRALQRFGVWVEPSLMAEWARLMRLYASRQGRSLDEAVLVTAMQWSEPTRDVRIARDRAAQLLANGKVHCVWSGKRLTAGNLDIDHCLPWAAWPCGDLWNLMPAHRTVNQHEKRDRLPSDGLIRAAQDRIMSWWTSAYCDGSDALLSERFALEASASLPSIASSALDDIYAGMSLQRLRLKHDQQAPEWLGERHLR